MATYRCVVKCFWKGRMWSPSASEGEQNYTGDEKPPFAKAHGDKPEKPFFICLDPPKASEPAKPAESPTDAAMKDWMLKRMSKHDLLGIMERKYKTIIPEESITRDALVKLVLEKQAEFGTNQDIANELKG